MKIEDLIEVQWLCASKEEATTICYKLLQLKLIACANIQQDVLSLYEWKGQLEEAFEIKVSMKTLKSYFAKIQEIVIKEGSYEVPCLLAVAIQEVSASYKEWVLESLNRSSI